jgi:hypothetical protein
LALLFPRRLPALALGAALALIVVMLSLGRPAHAQGPSTLHVTGTADGTGSCDSAGNCPTLRAAVLQADADKANDVIMVPAGTYKLTSTLDVTTKVSISGAGADTTFVDGDGKVRVFDVEQQGEALLSTLTVQHGQVTDDPAGGGGGILNLGTLRLSAVRIVDNKALSSNETAAAGGGILSLGPMSSSGGLVSGNVASGAGGGIADAGTFGAGGGFLVEKNEAFVGGGLVFASTAATVTVSGITVRDNSATVLGGGILTGGGANLFMVDSLVSGNTVGEDLGNAGGGIVNVSGTVKLVNVTLAGNVAPGSGGIGGDSAGGGFLQFDPSAASRSAAARAQVTGALGAMRWARSVANGSATATLDFLTISGNRATHGGGIANLGSSSSLTLHNTILAGNTGGNCFSPLTSQGYNLADDQSCDLHGAGDQRNVDPRLKALAANGGPTLTMALTAGSPAVDAADPSCDAARDQRGVNRPQGPRCDIGAFELEAVTPPATAPPGPPVTGLGAVAAGQAPPGLWLALLALVVGLCAAGLVLVARRGRGV